MVSRDPKHLHPHLLAKWMRFYDAAEAAGIPVFITCTYRDDAEQARLYAQGRTAPGAIVTNAKPGQSKHNAVDEKGKPAAKAFDIALVSPPAASIYAEGPHWERLGQIGESLGLTWGGRWQGKKHDRPHFEI